jgi:tetratricopeptide (TPR) repeat protein
LLWTIVLLCGGCARAFTLSSPPSDAYRRAVTEARAHADAKRFTAAARSYDRAARMARRRVDREEARYREAKVWVEAGRPGRALLRLDEIGSRRPVARRTVRARYDAAVLRARCEDAPAIRRRGVAELKAVIRDHPDSGLGGRAFDRVVRRYRDREDRAGLRAYLDEAEPALRATTLGDNVLWERAALAEHAGDRVRARALLERVVEEHPYPQGHLWDNALLRLAQLDLDAGQPERAAERLAVMLDRRDTTNLTGSYTLPTFPEAQLWLARIYRDRLDAPVKAAEAFRTLYEDYETSRLRDDALVELGELWIAEGRRREGCRRLAQAVREFEVGSARRRAHERLQRDCR